jgi:hypothetical protein
MTIEQTETCKELNCVCFRCPQLSKCRKLRCQGRLKYPYCEGFYSCDRRPTESRAEEKAHGEPT